jgi:hypothetical protein
MAGLKSHRRQCRHDFSDAAGVDGHENIGVTPLEPLEESPAGGGFVAVFATSTSMRA